MTPTEIAMRAILDRGEWPTVIKLNAEMPSRANGRPDLNGRECRLRGKLASEYGWVRVAHGYSVRWERSVAIQSG